MGRKKKNKTLVTQKRRTRLKKTFFTLRFPFMVVLFFLVTLPAVVTVIYQLISGKFTLIENSLLFEQVWGKYVFYFLHPFQNLQFIKSVPSLPNILYLIEGSLLLLYVVRFFGVWLQLKPHKVEEASDYGAYGTSRFATKNEIEDEENFISDIKNEAEFGTFIGKVKETGNYLIRKDDSVLNSHTMVVAGSGKGKTQAFALIQILLNRFRSIICSDGKNELYRKTSKQKHEQGFKILNIDFVHFLGNKWNPLDQMTFDDIDSFSTNLVQSVDDDAKSVWGNQGINYISSCIAYVLETQEKKYQNMTVVRRLMNKSEMEVKELFEALDNDSVAKDFFGEVSSATKNTWTGITTTAKSATRFWKQERVRRFTETSDFQFTDLGKEKIALYIRVHPNDKTFQPLVNTFFTQMFNQLIEGVDEFGGTYKVKMDFVLDEFTNIGEIPNFQGILSFVRALGLNIMPIVQDISQIDKVYSEEERKSIIGNCDNFLFLGTNESDVTAPMIVTKLGDTTMVVRNENEKAMTVTHSKDSLAFNYNKRDLMNASEILRMDKNKGIYIPSGLYPIEFEKVFAYRLFPNTEDMPLGWHLKGAEEEKQVEEKEEEPETETNEVNEIITGVYEQATDTTSDEEITQELINPYKNEDLKKDKDQERSN